MTSRNKYTKSQINEVINLFYAVEATWARPKE